MRFAPALAPVLAAAALVPAAAFAADAPSAQEQQWQLAGGQAVKIVVRRDGWYHVSRESLVAAGLDGGAPSKSLRLYTDGRQVPIQVRRDGSIEFLGVRRYGPTSDARTYWLAWGGEAGKRILAAKGTARRGSVARTYGWAVVERPRNVYYGWLKGGPSDFFFGPLVTPAKAGTATISAPSIDPQNAPRLDVAVQGFSTGTPQNPRTHEVSVSFNGTKVATTTFQNRTVGHAIARLPAGSVKPGDNTATATRTRCSSHRRSAPGAFSRSARKQCWRRPRSPPSARQGGTAPTRAPTW
jgi:hypothetical protein